MARKLTVLIMIFSVLSKLCKNIDFFYVSNTADHFQLIEQQMKTSQTTPYITILVAFKFPMMQLIECIFRKILNANIRSKHHLVCMSLKTAIANYGILTFSLPNVLDPLRSPS